MYKIVAVLFVVVNGAPTDKVDSIRSYKQTLFSTSESCLAFLDTDAGKAVIASAQRMIDERGDVAGQIGCLKVDQKSDDGGI